VVASGIARSATLALPTLPLGALVDVGGPVPRGGRRCFWRGPQLPVDPGESPHALYAWLFAGGPAGAEAARKRQLEDTSLLDYVGGELESFGERLGVEDRRVVEQHLGSIRELEKGLAMLARPGAAASCAPALGPPIDAHRRT